jgi:hypothetical protein
MGGGLIRVLVLAVVGCTGERSGEPDEPQEPNTQPGVEAGPDSSPGTRVTGSLGNRPFTLQHASIKRGSANDPRNWLCISNVALTFAQCEQSGGPERTMFLGPFIYDNDVPTWGLVQVGLYRVGDAPQSAFGRSGTIAISQDDLEGPFEMTLTVDFGETPVTMGSVSIR